ncbi:MAG: pectin acetylesterase-family hydrolase [Polyangiaceae bacterium]
MKMHAWSVMGFLRGVALMSIAGAAIGCTGGETNETDPEENTPKLPQGLSDGWNEFQPGGDTICSRGTEYAYWVRPGTVNKVVIDFIGGGACWNAATCGFADAIFEDSVDSVRSAVKKNEPHGIYDHDKAENPFKDWYHVIIPYCTGDIHWGNSVQTYSEGTAQEVTIRHKGAVNSRAVLKWVYENFSAPEQVLVTGCSAGSYGAALWSADVMHQYPDSDVLQFGDSGAGIITETFFQESFPAWNAAEAFPKDIPELDPSKVDIQKMALPDLYAGISNHYSTQWMSQYNTFKDENQTFYFTAMGGSGAAEWSNQMQASIAEIEERAPGFDSFTAPGEQHCILLYDNFYTVEAGGVKLVDWLSDKAAGKTVGSPKCEETECDKDTP